MALLVNMYITPVFMFQAQFLKVGIATMREYTKAKAPWMAIAPGLLFDLKRVYAGGGAQPCCLDMRCAAGGAAKEWIWAEVCMPQNQYRC